MRRNTMIMDRAFTAPKIMRRACLRTVCVGRIGMCNPPFYVIFWASSYSNLVVASKESLIFKDSLTFYGILILDKYKGIGFRKAFLIFGMCDESFSTNYYIVNYELIHLYYERQFGKVLFKNGTILSL